MSLQITGNIKLQNEVEVTSLYARTIPTITADGKSVYANPSFWVSEQHYLDGKGIISLQEDSLYLYEYDRTIDGIDILSFSNEKVKETLESFGYTVTISEL